MREFIDRSTVNISKTIGGQNDFADCIRDSVKAVIDNAETVTEQEIVKANLEKIKKQIIEESEFAYANFEEYKDEVLGVESDELPDDDFRYGLERAVDIINEFLREQEKEK